MNVYKQAVSVNLKVNEKIKTIVATRDKWKYREIFTGAIICKLFSRHAQLNVVTDQIGSPTYTVDLALLLCAMAVTDKYGTYHVTNEGVCSWAEFARAIFAQAGMRVKVNPIPASEYPTRAARPYNSRMSKAKLTQNSFSKLPAWQDALGRYLKELGKSKNPV